MTMRNYKRLPIIILFVSGILLFGCVAKQRLLREEDIVTVTTNLSSVSQADIERVKNEAEKALHNICPILGLQNNKSVKLRSEIDSGG
jgi:hypothetical protein